MAEPYHGSDRHELVSYLQSKVHKTMTAELTNLRDMGFHIPSGTGDRETFAERLSLP